MTANGHRPDRKALRKLTDIAYQRETERALSDLEERFAAWRRGEISCFTLNNAIHEYHDGVARDIWKHYNYFKPEQLVPVAVAKGVLRESELPLHQLEKFRQLIDAYRLSLDSGANSALPADNSPTASIEE